MNYHIMNSKEVSHIQEMLKSEFGFEEPLNYVFLVSNKEKVYIVNRETASADLKGIGISSLGMYFADTNKEGIRLSIEGSQIVGKKATKNIFEATEKEAREWLQGMEISRTEGMSGSVLIKH